MTVVADSTPLISLLKIGKIGLLEKLFRTVAVPCAVRDELCASGDFLPKAEEFLRCRFIKVSEAQDKKLVEILLQEAKLDLGESEAIVLAQKIGADVLLMDERKGRSIASGLGLHLMGTIGILLAALDEGLIDSGEINQIVDRLRGEHRFIGENLFLQLKAKSRIQL